MIRIRRPSVAQGKETSPLGESGRYANRADQPPHHGWNLQTLSIEISARPNRRFTTISRSRRGYSMGVLVMGNPTGIVQHSFMPCCKPSSGRDPWLFGTNKQTRGRHLCSRATSLRASLCPIQQDNFQSLSPAARGNRCLRRAVTHHRDRGSDGLLIRARHECGRVRVEAAIHGDAGRAHRVVAETANMNAAKATEMRQRSRRKVLASPGQGCSLTRPCALGLTL
jgi:hypothetical protein